MAKKQKKKRNKKYRPTYTTDARIDMSKGGRVGFANGGEDEREIAKEDEQTRREQEEEARRRQEQQNTPVNEAEPTDTQQGSQANTNTTTTTDTTEATETPAAPTETSQPFDPGFGNVVPGQYPDSEKPDATGAMKRATPVGLKDPSTQSAFQVGREYRALRTGARAEELAAGQLPADLPKIPDPKKLVSDEGKVAAGTEIDAATAAELQMSTESNVQAATLGSENPETVSELPKQETHLPLNLLLLLRLELKKLLKFLKHQLLKLLVVIFHLKFLKH